MHFLKSRDYNSFPTCLRHIRGALRYALLAVLAQNSLIVSPAAQEASTDPNPTYPVQAQAPMFQLVGNRPTMELIGIDLTQNNTPIKGKVPQINAGTPLDITLYVRPMSTLIADRKLRINIRPPGVGPAPSYLEFFPFDLGEWKYRAIRQETYRMELPLRRFAGRGMMNIAEVDPSDQDWRRFVTLWTMQVDIPAQVWRSGLERAQIDKAFGPHAKRIFAAFSLGPGTEVAAPIGSLDYPVSRVGIITNLSWHNDLTIGDSICQISFGREGNGEESPITVVYGETTYKEVVTIADDVPAAASAHLAWASPIPGDATRKRERRYYSAEFSISEKQRPSEIVFKYQGGSGMLHVYEVVLLGNF